MILGRWFWGSGFEGGALGGGVVLKGWFRGNDFEVDFKGESFLREKKTKKDVFLKKN